MVTQVIGRMSVGLMKAQSMQTLLASCRDSERHFYDLRGVLAVTVSPETGVSACNQQDFAAFCRELGQFPNERFLVIRLEIST